MSFHCFLMTALARCVHWRRIVVSTPGPGETQPFAMTLSLPHLLFFLFFFPFVFVVAASESLALSINPLLSGFSIHLIHGQDAGADGSKTRKNLRNTLRNLNLFKEGVQYFSWFSALFEHPSPIFKLFSNIMFALTSKWPVSDQSSS